MKIGIIGAGFTGLTAGLTVSEKGHKVTIFEKETVPGGLAAGFKSEKWKWYLEKHYHHLFTNDSHAISLAKRVGVRLTFVQTTTSVFFKNRPYQFNSPLNLLTFPHLGIADKLRTGATLLYLKATSNWKPLEKISATRFLKRYMGSKSWEVLWQPLFEGKFGRYMSQIPASWFWARIKKRTPWLGYPIGGFTHFADVVAERVVENEGAIKFNCTITTIKRDGNQIKLFTDKGETYFFDKVVCTLPFNILTRIAPDLPQRYKRKISTFRGIGAINLIVATNKSLLGNRTYWLNVCEKNFPFLAVIEHTNFMSRKIYGNHNLVYVGNYLPANHQYFELNKTELLNVYLPYLKKINRNFSKKDVAGTWLFKTAFAQPIITTDYSNELPGFETPIKNLFVANIQQVYPWDRGTNYAIKMGEDVGKLLMKDEVPPAGST